MPFFKLKKLWEYCSYNIPFFILVLVLILILSLIPDFSTQFYGSKIGYIVGNIVWVLLVGYGMSITRNRMNHGKRLPKIIIKDVIVMGIKASIVFAIYFFIQWVILYFVSSYFNYPIFDLEDMLLNIDETIDLIRSNDLMYSAIFFGYATIIFYVTTFFAEIAIARLADTKSIFSSFNLIAIIKTINVIGWGHYVRDYTSIILVIVILSYLQLIVLPIFLLDTIWEVTLGFLVFVAQFLGIGAVYSEFKDKELNRANVN